MPLTIAMDHYGPPDVLRPVERESVEPGPGEAVVRVAVAAVNRADCFIRSGEWPHAGGFPYVPGLEACGVVERVGSGVTLRPGDRVITMMQRMGGVHGARPGGYQEELVAPADTLARVPDELPLETAGTLGLAAVTAKLALDELGVVRGQRVLVHGGSSGVGTMAIQLVVAAGAYVLATGTRPEKFSLLRELGAHETIATSSPGWSASVAPVDRVFDLIGTATFRESIELLAPGGRYVFVGGTTGGDLALSGWTLMRPITLTGWSSETLTCHALQRAIDELAAEYAAGRLRVARVERFALRHADAAHELVESGRAAGRVVLIP